MAERTHACGKVTVDSDWTNSCIKRLGTKTP